jgi:acyl-CoA thioester hydrolase
MPDAPSPPLRSTFPHVERLSTRWNDNDVYGHVNNVVHYMLFDTVINGWLIAEGGLDIHRGDVIGLCVESHCSYHSAVEFPAPIDAGLRAGKIGRSSIRYELGLFAPDAEEPAAHGWFVHVFVDRETRRPVELPAGIRAAMERLEVPA